MSGGVGRAGKARVRPVLDKRGSHPWGLWVASLIQVQGQGQPFAVNPKGWASWPPLISGSLERPTSSGPITCVLKTRDSILTLVAGGPALSPCCSPDPRRACYPLSQTGQSACRPDAFSRKQLKDGRTYRHASAFVHIQSTSCRASPPPDTSLLLC